MPLPGRIDFRPVEIGGTHLHKKRKKLLLTMIFECGKSTPLADWSAFRTLREKFIHRSLGN